MASLDNYSSYLLSYTENKLIKSSLFPWLVCGWKLWVIDGVFFEVDFCLCKIRPAYMPVSEGLGSAFENFEVSQFLN